MGVTLVRARDVRGSGLRAQSHHIKPWTPDSQPHAMREALGVGRDGVALLLTFLLMLVLAGVVLAVSVFAHNSFLTGTMELQDKQAYYIAEAGWQRARQALNAGTWQAAVSSGNTYSETFGAGLYSVIVVDDGSTIAENGSTSYTITSSAYVPNQSNPVAKRQMIEYQTDVTASNTNLSLAATATASSTRSSNTASKAKDGDNSTKWQANNKGPNEWLKMDYSSATAINEMIVRDDGNINSTFQIQWSDDDSSWTAVSSLSISENSNNVFTATFTSTTHRYFRAVFTDIDSNSRVGVKELEAYNTANRTVTFDNAGKVTTQW